MATSECMRAQILANAAILLSPTTTATETNPTVYRSNSITTLTPANSQPAMEAVVFGHSSSYQAAVMVGVVPAIEGAESPTPESAMRKLLLATAELLEKFMPEVGVHQKVLVGGGVFDEEMIGLGKERAGRKGIAG